MVVTWWSWWSCRPPGGPHPSCCCTRRLGVRMLFSPMARTRQRRPAPTQAGTHPSTGVHPPTVTRTVPPSSPACRRRRAGEVCVYQGEKPTLKETAFNRPGLDGPVPQCAEMGLATCPRREAGYRSPSHRSGERFRSESLRRRPELTGTPGELNRSVHRSPPEGPGNAEGPQCDESFGRTLSDGRRNPQASTLFRL